MLTQIGTEVEDAMADKSVQDTHSVHRSQMTNTKSSHSSTRQCWQVLQVNRDKDHERVGE